MNLILRSLGAAVAVLFAVAAQGQICYDATIVFESNLSDGGPTSVSATLMTGEDTVIIPQFEATLNAESGTWQETFCLFPGCYTLAIIGNVPLNEDLFDVQWSAFGGDQDIEVVFGDATVWYSFCVSPEVMSDCPDEIDYAQADGCDAAFEIGSFVEGELVVWTFGDESGPYTGGHFTEHTYPGNGVYTVTAWYTSSECPDGVNLTTTIEVTGCGGECNFEGGSTFIDCGVVQLNGFGLPDPVQPTWYIDGEYVGSGQEILVDGLAPEEGVECYEVTGYAEMECGLATSTFEFCMEACGGGGDCPLEIEASTDDGMWWTFTAYGPAEGTALDWFIDGNFMTTNETGTFEAGFDFNPFWEVCVQYAAAPCEGIVEACYDNMGGSGCPDGIFVDQLEGCAYLITIGDGNPNASVGWMVDETYLNSNETSVVVEFPEGGVHVVTGYYVSTTCPGETYAITIDATGCNDACPIEANANQIDCDSFVVWAAGVPVGASIAWTLDGEAYESSALEFIYNITDGECHVFGYTMTSGDCEGEEAEVQICPTACDECAAEIVIEELTPGIYLFTAFAADGSLYSGPTNWWVGPELVASSNPAAYTWMNDVPEVANVCAGFPAWEGCPTPSEQCTELQPVAPECEEVTLSLDVNITAGVEAVLPWLLAAEIAGVDLSGLDLAGEWIWEVDAEAFEVTFCLPAACFDLFLDWTDWGFNPEEMENWTLEVLIGELAAWSFDNLTTVEGLIEFGMTEDCMPMEVAQAQAVQGLLFPNPATDWVQFASNEAVHVQVFTLEGTLIFEGQTQSLNLSNWSPGWYAVRTTDRSGQRLTQRLLVVR